MGDLEAGFDSDSDSDVDGTGGNGGNRGDEAVGVDSVVLMDWDGREGGDLFSATWLLRWAGD